MNNKKGFLPLALLIAILIVVAGGSAYYFVKQKQSVVPTAPQQSTPLSPDIQSSVPSDWKTYRNEKYGFEFKYPNQSMLGNEKVDLIQTHIENDLCVQKDGSFIGGDMINNITFKGKMGYAGVIVCVLKEQHSIEDLLKQFDSSTEPKIIIVNGVRALKTIDKGMAELEQVTIPISNTSITISSRFGLVDSSVFDQIISTFKFTK